MRGGGHNAGGLGVWDDALVIDLSPMRGVLVDPAAKTALVQGGCVWGDVDHATGAFGLATPSGFLSTTGVGGLTLGGGIGYLSRRYGLTIDNLLSADVVLADGSFVTASERQHPDLFWALRGGGGNFGVVTSFEFRCHDVGTVVAGPVLYDIADAGDVLRWYREVLPGLPEELNGWLGLLTIPPAPPFPEELWLRKACGIVWCYTGPPERADEVLGPVRGFGSPLLDAVMPHALPGAAEHLRRAVPARAAVVLAGRLLQRDLGRGDRGPPGVRRGAAHAAFDHAPVPDRRGRAPGQPGGRPRSPTGTPAGPASSSASTRTRPTRPRSRTGRCATGMPCTPPPPGART